MLKRPSLALFNFLFILPLSFILIGGCGSSSTPSQQTPQSKAVPVQTKEEPAQEKEEEEIPIYVYQGDRFRDPFTPVGFTTNYQPDAIFDPQRAQVRGIIYGSSRRTAAINIGGTGSYFIKKGRIYDIMGKAVEGFRARVFMDKVVLYGEADEVYEIYIRETEEERT